MRRPSWVNLNGEWDLALGDRGRFEQRIIVPFCPQSRLSGLGSLSDDVIWYRRLATFPNAECLLLHFGAVDYRATIWVNEVEVAQHEGGHTPFTADVTAAAVEGENLIVVRVEDPLTDKTIPRGKQFWASTPEGIFYTATTGIWQTVWLEPLPARRIRTLEFDPDLGAGAVRFAIDADGRTELTVRLDGAIVGRWSGEVERSHIELDQLRAWSPESPTLYDVEARLFDTHGREVDRVDSYFGLRTVGTAHGRFLLNGQPYVQRLVLDQGYFPGGLLTAANDATLRRDIEVAKAFGFNGARKHQKIEDPRWLYWADRLGFLVWSEMPSFHEHSPAAEARLLAEWETAVRRDQSHPCIVAWVPANESFGLDSVGDAVRTRFLIELYRRTKALDGTRLVISNDGWEHALTDLCTVHDYGDPDALRRRFRDRQNALEPDAPAHPTFLPGYGYRGEPILVSEFGGLRMAGSAGWGYQDVAGSTGFIQAYRAMVGALMQPGPVEGFAYTQLADVEQEQNGLLSADRRPKLDPAVLRPITQMPKAR